MVEEVVLFRLTEIIILQLMLNSACKKNGFLYKTATNFARWRVVHGMEARCRDIVSIHRFTERKTGLRSILSLPYNICVCVEHLAITDISQTDGLWVVMDNLDKICTRNKQTIAYIALKDSFSYKRTTGRNINNFFGMVQIFVKKLRKFEITLSK